MPPTITATGSLGKSLVSFAYLIASSSTWQGIINASSASEAMLRVHYDADDLPDSDDIRPRVLVSIDPGYTREQDAVLAFRGSARLVASFEIPPSDAYADGNRWDQLIEHTNRMDGIIANMESAQGNGTGYFAAESHIHLQTIELITGPMSVVEVVENAGLETKSYFWVSELACTWMGR